MRVLNPLLPLTLFAVAFGYLEATVVVYLRQIYYPDGFQFEYRHSPTTEFQVTFDGAGIVTGVDDTSMPSLLNRP